MSYGEDGIPPDGDPAWASLLKGPPAPEIQRLLSDIERFASRPGVSRSAAELGDDLPVLRHCIDLLELQFAQRAAVFASTDEYARDGSLSPETWIRHHCGMSGVAAAGAVRVGEQMKQLPESTAAMRDGRIGFAHLSMIARTAVASTAGNLMEPPRARTEGAQNVEATTGQAPNEARSEAQSAAPKSTMCFDERPLLQLAQEHSVSRFRHDCAHTRHAADARGFLVQHLSEAAWATFEMVPCDGGVVLRGQLDEVAGATLRAALEPLAKRKGPEDTRRRKKRMADALVELANHVLDSGALPSQAGQRPHLQVTATVDTLIGAPGAPAGELQYADPVPAATVQRLACDSSVTRILLDSASAIVDVGRVRRIPPAATRRALLARDKGCAWPGCERPPSWTAAHHLHHWAHGGRTDLQNLALLCHRHHYLVHEAGWRLLRSEDGRLVTLPPFPNAPMPGGVLPPEADSEPRELAQRYVEIMRAETSHAGAVRHARGPDSVEPART